MAVDYIVDALAVAEHVEDGRESADVLGEGAVEQQVAVYAVELREHDADDLGALRHLEAREPLGRHEVGEVVDDPAQVVDAIGVRDERMPGLALAHLLGGAVVVADVHHARDDLLVAQADDNVHHAVGAAVLRADVQKHDLGVAGQFLEAPVLGPKGEHLLPLCGALGRHQEATELGAPGGRLLAQRMTLPPRRHENPGSRRQAVEAHAEHVPDFALVPLGRREHARDRGQRGRLAQQGDLEPHVAVVLERQQVVDDREIAPGWPSRCVRTRSSIAVRS